MKSSKTAHLPAHASALVHLRGAHPGLALFIENAPPCPFIRKTDYFPALCRAILAQQVSAVAAKTVTARFRELFPRGRPTAQGLAGLSDEALRGCGLGPQKVGYLRALATAHLDGTLPLGGWHRLSDEDIITKLTAVRGIGKWTAEMFLIFVLARPDVWPMDDLAIQTGVQKLLKLKARPTRKQLEKLGKTFSPHRSVASWYLWRLAHA